jgi:hypothetical protein
MTKLRFAVLLAIMILPVSLLGQHGSAENGYFPVHYQGDTWTGIVSAIDLATRKVSLVYTHKQKTAVFEGVLANGYRVQTNDDKEKKQIAAMGIAVGTCLRVYYIPEQTSNEVGGSAQFKAFGSNHFAESRDAKERFNLIFLVEFLPEEGESRTGTVITTNDSTREITLAVTGGAKTENFVGVVVDGYQVKMKDGGFHDLIISQIPVGTKMLVHYFDVMAGDARTTDKVHRIYRVQFLSFPQTP